MKISYSGPSKPLKVKKPNWNILIEWLEDYVKFFEEDSPNEERQELIEKMIVDYALCALYSSRILGYIDRLKKEKE